MTDSGTGIAKRMLDDVQKAQSTCQELAELINGSKIDAAATVAQINAFHVAFRGVLSLGGECFA